MRHSQIPGDIEQIDRHARILHSLIPLKFDDGSVIPMGLVFIGFATHQTTGIGMHMHTHLIPTIERENLDLQDPYLASWNKELLSAAGQIIRFIYDQTIHDTIKTMDNSSCIDSLFASYAFHTTYPHQQIGIGFSQIYIRFLNRKYSGVFRYGHSKRIFCIEYKPSRASTTIASRVSILIDPLITSLSGVLSTFICLFDTSTSSS